MKDCFKILGWSLLYSVAVFVGMMAGFFHPFLWVYNAILTSLLAAWPYFRIVKGWPMAGITLCPLVLSIVLNLLMGEGDWLYVVLAVIIGLATEIVRKVCGDYRSRKSLIGGYMVFALLPFANTLRMWIWPEASMVQTVEEMGQAYADQMGSVIQPWVLSIGFVLTLFISWLCGNFFAKKH